MLPLLPLVGLATGLAGAGGAIWQSTANDEAARLNKERLEQLKKLQARGALGLTPVEERNLQETLVSPVQKAAAEGRLRAEQIAASTGTATAGDLSRLRTEQTRATSEAGQQAALVTRQADLAKKEAQLAEIEGRTQAKGQYKADDIQTILSGLSQSAAVGGAIAGSPVGTLPNTLMGAAGMPFIPPAAGASPSAMPAQALAGLSPQQQQQLATWAAANPAAFQQALLQAMQMQGQAVPTGAFLAPSGRVES